MLGVIRKHKEPEKSSGNADMDPDTTLTEISMPHPQKSRVAQQEGEQSKEEQGFILLHVERQTLTLCP